MGAAAPVRPSSPSAPREAWIDVAKGIAIVLVVLYHSVLFLDVIGWAGAWTASFALDSLRMPLFFFMSGILAAKAMSLRYRDLFRRRILLLLYLYVVWGVGQWVFTLAVPVVRDANFDASWQRVTVGMFLWPSPALWFLYALALYLTIAWMVRRVAPVAQIVVAAIISTVFGVGLAHTSSPWDKMGIYLVFFVAGIHLAAATRRFVTRIRWWHPTVLGVLFAGAVLALVATRSGSIPFVLLTVSTLGVVFGISTAVVLARLRQVDVLRYLGTRTLPIYLFHTLPLAVMATVLGAMSLDPAPAVVAVLPLVLAAVAIGLSLAVYSLLRTVPGIYTVPAALTVRVARWTGAASPSRPEQPGKR